MAKYNVTFSCGECGRFHPTEISLSLHQGLPPRENIYDVYEEESLPPEIIKLFRTPALCPVTRNSVVIDYSARLYVVAVA